MYVAVYKTVSHSLLLLLFKTLQCTYVAISYIQTSTMIKFISCTDGPQATGPVANVMYII